MLYQKFGIPNVQKKTSRKISKNLEMNCKILKCNFKLTPSSSIQS